MKKIANIFLLMTFLFSSCDSDNMDGLYEEPREANVNLPCYVYKVAVSFSDINGYDLVAPLANERWKKNDDNSEWYGEINPERYSLDILLPNPHESWDNSIYNFRARTDFMPDVLNPFLAMKKYDKKYNCTSLFGEQYSEGDGSWYLLSTFRSPAQNGTQDHLTYKIICPTIIGDETAHELVVMWDYDSVFSDNFLDSEAGELFPEGSKASFDGKPVSICKIITTHTESRDYFTYFLDIVLDR